MLKVKSPLLLAVLAVALLLSSCNVRLVPATAPVSPIAAKTWFYDQLSETEERIYTALYTDALSGEELFVGTDGELSPYEVARIAQSAVDALLRDHPETFYLAFGSGRTSFTPSVSEDGAPGIRITPVLRSLDAPTAVSRFSQRAMEISVSGTNDAERALSIAEAIASLVNYDIAAPHADTAYGALVEGKANCLGIALAFHYVASLHGLRTLVISGEHGESYKTLHAWNYIQLEDGRFYALDISETVANGAPLLFSGASSVSESSPLRFSERYRPSGDISGFGEKVFSLPTLSYYPYS